MVSESKGCSISWIEEHLKPETVGSIKISFTSLIKKKAIDFI